MALTKGPTTLLRLAVPVAPPAPKYELALALKLEFNELKPDPAKKVLKVAGVPTS